MQTAFGFLQVLILWGFFCVLTPERTYAQSAAGADTALYASLLDADSSLDVLPDSLATPTDTVMPLDDILRRMTHDKALDSLIQKRLAYYKDHPTQGYSVLFFSASGNHSGVAAEQANERFQFLYPETPTYLSYDAPYYKLKAGNFRTRLEASAFLARIQSDYPNAFVVRDVLDIKHLLRMEEPEPEPVSEETDGDTENPDAAPVE